MTRTEVYVLIDTERERQHTLWGKTHEWGHGDCSSKQVDVRTKALILAEECGEVARAILDGENLHPELVQVAAVAVAWLESFPGVAEPG